MLICDENIPWCRRESQGVFFCLLFISSAKFSLAFSRQVEPCDVL